jgi:hypothetical protein
MLQQREVQDVSERITARQFHEAKGVEDWRVIGEGSAPTSAPAHSGPVHGIV